MWVIQVTPVNCFYSEVRYIFRQYFMYIHTYVRPVVPFRENILLEGFLFSVFHWKIQFNWKYLQVFERIFDDLSSAEMWDFVTLLKKKKKFSKAYMLRSYENFSQENNVSIRNKLNARTTIISNWKVFSVFV